jgi:hypothetical protein
LGQNSGVGPQFFKVWGNKPRDPVMGFGVIDDFEIVIELHLLQFRARSSIRINHHRKTKKAT